MRRTAGIALSTLIAATSAIGLAGTADARPTSSAPSPASATSVRTQPYVALGDSYSSAAGVMPQVPGAPAACSRSLLNFAHDIATATRASSFTDVTCSGAKTSDFFTSQLAGVAPQLDAVTKQTRLVTMTIGGNDGDVFATSFFGCASVAASDPTGNPCEQKFGNTFVNAIRTTTYPNLVKTLTAVRAKAPNATVVIVGYPTILPAVGSPACLSSVPIALGDVPWLGKQQAVLNNAVRRAALATGAVYVDMTNASMGHDACQPEGTRWIEPAIGPVNAFPIHPNAQGEAAMAARTLAVLGRL
ncbi:SGNH/GDSL hydrolase family protein [Lapillicoccus jejuensis]|uniref:GDSL-like lipase/acylhydrolase family protein n=1 Tax=Lapillicoccus jejuensis TaxID=402171 RepID=A0A542DZ61_9MICO|nr:SGNH/GDSL hydrolase family protein [Lapillicoccus jejuensis]TQJ08339.1 GDSL-like lipase/acylhydrolase family protein [Lapillicoccus jejuensis]